jgi:hypothetical protein
MWFVLQATLLHLYRKVCQYQTSMILFSKVDIEEAEQ